MDLAIVVERRVIDDREAVKGPAEAFTASCIVLTVSTSTVTATGMSGLEISSLSCDSVRSESDMKKSSLSGSLV
jgi:hypothetical protein